MASTLNVLGFPVRMVKEKNNSYSAWVPAFNVASQGDTQKEALTNVQEALELHLECLSPSKRTEAEKAKIHVPLKSVHARAFH